MRAYININQKAFSELAIFAVAIIIVSIRNLLNLCKYYSKIRGIEQEKPPNKVGGLGLKPFIYGVCHFFFRIHSSGSYSIGKNLGFLRGNLQLTKVYELFYPRDWVRLRCVS
jgi:hypothetical protein